MDDSGAVYTGTDDGAVWRVRADGGRIDRVGRHGRPAARSRAARPTGGCWSATHAAVCSRSTRAPARIEELTDARARPADGVLQQRRRAQRRRHLVLRLLAGVYGSTAGRPTSSRTPAPDGCCAGHRRDGRGGARGLRFANGVALAADESYVAVAETGRPDRRTPLADRRRGPGERDHLATDLPGYPDNIARGSDGLIWVTIASPRDPVLERLMTGPLPVRRLAWRLPDRLQPEAEAPRAGDGASTTHGGSCTT